MEDQQIVALYWDRSERAIAETSAKYGSYCHAIAFQILASGEDAEESVNDTWLAAWNAMPPHRPAILSAFLGKITRRIAIDRWRSLRAEKRGGGETALALEELEGCVPGGGTVEGEVEAGELARAVDEFVMALPLLQRRVFLRRYWYLDSLPAISQRFGFSQSKVKVMLWRIREKLRLHLEKEGLWQ